MKSQQSGFTLVEIAIVLVIIGLLLGGILKGQELINSAKVKNIANDFRVIPTYIYAYQDKFKSLPGDDCLAGTHVGAPAVDLAVPCPAPAGNGQFIVQPLPLPSPVSCASPVPGYQGDWCVLKKNTEPSV